jgi:hypothetical protein
LNAGEFSGAVEELFVNDQGRPHMHQYA